MKETDNLPKFDRYQRYYSTHKFWARIKHLGSKAGEQIVYNALLLHYVLKSPDVSVKNKGLIIGALGYLILPVDLIPDAIPIVGTIDDVAGVLLAMVNAVGKGSGNN